MSQNTPPLDESLQRLEQELASFTPLAPTERLRGSISKALRHAPEESVVSRDSEMSRMRRRHILAGGLPLAIAAVLALMAAVLVEPTPSAPAGPMASTGQPSTPEPPAEASSNPLSDISLQPVSMETRLLGEEEQGVHRAERLSYLLVRRRYLEIRVLRNPKTGALVKFQVPREELVRVPIPTQ